VKPHQKNATITQTFLSLALSLLLVGCVSVAPLDPIIGDSARPQSAVARSLDVVRYELELEIFPERKSIAGVGRAEFLLLQNTDKLELKLDSRFDVSRVEVLDQDSEFIHKDGVIEISLSRQQNAGDSVLASVYYSGKPHVAVNAPWDGGFVWSETSGGIPWVATAIHGKGCDLFWPCMDHFGDKADTMRITLTVPNTVSAVTNGVLQSTKPVGKHKHQFDWLLSVPASDYNISVNVGPFSRIQKTYTSVNGLEVPIEFWALKQNEDKARTLIDNDLIQQIKFFEERLGPYPWGEQKIGFVETPHLGMEHQTINAYGMGFKLETDSFDWLLQHELAHEWFGNLMTHRRLNDAWLHEGFAEYMQAAYALDKFGSAAYIARMHREYLRIENCQPIVLEEVISNDQAFGGDIYHKGAWVLHTLRWLIGEDVFWQATRELLYGRADTKSLAYPMDTVYRNTDDFLNIVNRRSGQDYAWLFDVYLKHADLPKILESRDQQQLTLGWQTPNNKPFPMPIPISIDGELTVVKMENGQVSIDLGQNDRVIVDPEMKVLRYLPFSKMCKEIPVVD
jgi:aminopeptidase N